MRQTVDDSTPVCRLLQPEYMKENGTLKIEFPEKQRDITALRPTLGEDGLWRVRGRFRFSPQLELGFKAPVLVDGKHPVAAILAKHYHEVILHHVGGPKHLLAATREGWWLIRPTQALNHALKTCTHCVRRRGRPGVTGRPSRAAG